MNHYFRVINIGNKIIAICGSLSNWHLALGVRIKLSVMDI